MEDPVRKAFGKVKEDISQLRDQLISLSDQINGLKRTLTQTDRPSEIQTDIPTPLHFHSTHNQTHQTDTESTNKNNPPQVLKRQNSASSIGNEGVQTDRQTNQQTDITTQKFALTNKEQFTEGKIPQGETLETNHTQNTITRIEKVAEVLNSLDAIKKELRTQFKRLTNQEMLVFSSIYQLEGEGFSVDYSLLAKKTNLSESSIRDYVQKLVKKSIPLTKAKENNKRVVLSIPQEFKHMASLPTIISLREL